MYRSEKNEQDVLYILNNLRAEDEEEIIQLLGSDWKQEVFQSIMKNETTIAKTKKDNTPVLMWGVQNVGSSRCPIGCIWLLSTDNIKNNFICFLREMKKEIDLYDKRFLFTYNIIYKKNCFAKKWLKWVGFKFNNKKFKEIKLPKGFKVFYRKGNYNMGLGL